MRLGVLEAKTRFSELVDRAEKGEEIIITRRGAVVAKITPVAKPEMSPGEYDSWLSQVAALRAQTKPATTAQTIADRHAGHKY